MTEILFVVTILKVRLLLNVKFCVKVYIFLLHNADSVYFCTVNFDTQLKYYCIMEIKVFTSLEQMKRNHSIYCARVFDFDVDSYCFKETINVFKSIYGESVIISFVCV